MRGYSLSFLEIARIGPRDLLAHSIRHLRGRPCTDAGCDHRRSSGEHSVAPSSDDGLVARANSEFPADASQVGLDCLRREEQPAADLDIGAAKGNLGEYVQLARTQCRSRPMFLRRHAEPGQPIARTS